MALYIPLSIFHLARLLYVRPEILDPTTYTVLYTVGVLFYFILFYFIITVIYCDVDLITWDKLLFLSSNKVAQAIEISLKMSG